MELCFISYARSTNLDGRLSKFVEKLRQQLPARLPKSIDKKDVAFFDVSSIENGDEWMTRLSDATRKCKVCLCFYSPPYFTSEYSGREVQVFLERVRQWEQNSGNTNATARAIIPVLWIPHDSLPPKLARYQHDNAKFPRKYAETGLQGLAMRKSGADAYNAVLVELATQIAKTVQVVDLPEGQPIASFDAIESAFHSTAPVRYGAAVVVLVEQARRLQPFDPGGPSLDTMIESIANRCGIPARELKVTKNVSAEITGSIAARELPLLVVDRSSLDSVHNTQIVRDIVATLDDSATIVCLPDPSSNLPGAGAYALASLMPWIDSAPESAVLRPGDASSLEAELERRLRRARNDLIAADPAARATDAGLEADAKAKGIAIGARPVLTGPGV